MKIRNLDSILIAVGVALFWLLILSLFKASIVVRIVGFILIFLFAWFALALCKISATGVTRK